LCISKKEIHNNITEEERVDQTYGPNKNKCDCFNHCGIKIRSFTKITVNANIEAPTIIAASKISSNSFIVGMNCEVNKSKKVPHRQLQGLVFKVITYGTSSFSYEPYCQLWLLPIALYTAMPLQQSSQ